jgi:hypothetical protein
VIRAAKWVALTALALPIIVLGSVFLFWLGRPVRDAQRVVDDVEDDPGVDVDAERIS